jgi:uncharacterized protein with GYD domain
MQQTARPQYRCNVSAIGALVKFLLSQPHNRRRAFRRCAKIAGGGRGKEKNAMATFIILANYTEQGLREVKDTLKRKQALIEMAAKFGVTVKDIYWTLGQFDMLATVEGPDDVSVTSLTLALSVAGKIHTQTIRAFQEEEMQIILDKVAATQAA